jgi:uncharacterized protein (TIGR03067 family)
MRRAVLLSVVLLAAAAGFAPAPLPRSERRREGQDDLSGKWKFVVWKNSGRESRITQKLDVRPGAAEFILLDDSARVTYEFILYPHLSPRGFEWKRGGERYVGSYRMRGDRLVLIFKNGKTLAQRPTDFSGDADYHFELRRQSR